MMHTRHAILGFSLALAAGAAALAAPKEHPRPRPDFADMVQGGYDGDVVSDSRGGGRQGVHFTVEKVGPNTVRVVSDYPRLPPFTTRLARYMETIQGVGVPQVFLFEISKTPRILDITDDEARWVGHKTEGGDD